MHVHTRALNLKLLNINLKKRMLKLIPSRAENRLAFLNKTLFILRERNNPTIINMSLTSARD
jgi:hypothetical protein